MSLALLALLLFPLALAQTSSAVCGSVSFAWENNDKGQSPCIVASTIISYTWNQPFNLWALQTSNARYPGPTKTDEDQWGYNRAVCSLVTYSLLSGCSYCQGSEWPSWPAHSEKCNSTYLGNDQGAIKGLPIDVPSLTSIPVWAQVDYSTLPGQTWDPVKAQTVANSTETDQGNDAESSGRKSSIAGPVAGGVVGGLAFLAAILGGVWYYRRRKRTMRSVSDVETLRSEKDKTSTTFTPSSLPSSPGVTHRPSAYTPPQASIESRHQSMYPAQFIQRSAVPELQSQSDLDEPDTYESFRRAN